MLEEIVEHSNGSSPQIVVNEKAQFFAARLMNEFMKQQVIHWKTLSVYSPMTNGLSERMNHTVKPRGRFGRNYTKSCILV